MNANVDIIGPTGIWSCERCGFTSPWWRGSERFKLCVACADEARRNAAPQPKIIALAPEKRNNPRERVQIMAILRRQTGKALLLQIDGRELWLPKSQTTSPVPLCIGARSAISLPRWLAQRGGLT